MKPPLRTLRDDHTAVTEVMGTILILGMTVSLFAVIIIWVTSIPTPTAGVRLELDGQLIPIKDVNNNWAGVNITLTHRGGESLNFFDTRVYLTIQKVSGARTTEILRLRGTIAWGPNLGNPYGLIDGNDNFWNINERWAIVNKTVQPQDRVTAEVIDQATSSVLWNQQILGPVGSHPPIFLEKWADENPDTSTIETPMTGASFVVYAKVSDDDGDLKTVNATLTIFYGTGDACKNPQSMYDDGTNGDKVPGDGVWTLSRECMVPMNLTWDNSIILFTATDGNFVSTSRMVLHVVVGPLGEEIGPGQNQTFSGRPPNLRYNGLQGYNLFNASEWNAKEFAAKETRTFKGNEQVVVVVGSYLLKDAGAIDQFYLYDPYGGAPPKAVVYGTSKTPTFTTKPSNLQAFRFYKQVNGYNVFIYKFDLNNASGAGVQYLKNPVHPPFYFFARYSLTMQIMDSYGERFNTTDAVNITDMDGYMRQFPLVETFKDSAYTQKSNAFRSTDVVYVSVSMFTIDANTDNVQFGTVSIRDFLGGTQVQKGFANMRDSNPPLCPWTGGACTGRALGVDGVTITYRFSVNLTLADQDPWVEGGQNYALQLSFVHDLDETYSGLAKQLVITAALYRMDIAGGNSDTTNPAWGTHDYGYYYENLNGLDKWRKIRYDYCGLPGTGNCKNSETHAVAFIDADRDGDLDVTASVKLDNNNAELNYYRRDLDFDGNVVFVKFTLTTFGGNAVYCNRLATGDLTGDDYPEIVCGMTNGILYYFRNDGTWTSGSIGSGTQVTVDSTRGSQINGVTIGDFNRDGGNDIAVARQDGTVTYYLNLDGLGTFSTGTLTTRHFAEGEVTSVGSVTVPDYLKTYTSNDDWEVVQEGLFTESSLSGNTTNSGFNTGAAPWTYVDWEDANYADRAWQGSGGNPGGLVNLQEAFHASSTVSGYWYQSFTVSGSSPFSATVALDRKVSQWLTSGAGTLYVYVFVDPTSGLPNPANAIQTYTHTGTSGWTSSGAISVPSSRIPAAGTYYLKFATRITFPGSGAGTVITQFDNVQLNWTSTGGQASEMKHYWRIQQIPNRPLSSYSLRLEAHRSASTDGDTFVIAYATDVTGGDPTTGTYTTILWVNSTVDAVQTYNFPVSLQNKIVWMRVIDTDHHAGNTTLDSVFVDQMYIEVQTSTIAPGSVISLPSTPGAATAINAADRNGDGFWDVVVGSSNGKVYVLAGSSGGLITPGGAFYPSAGGVGASIAGVKWGNITSASPDLEIVLTYGTNVRVISGTGSTGNPIALLAPGTATTIQSLGVGDVDGDGDDDIVVATAATVNALVYYRNLQYTTGIQWRNINIEPNPPGPQTIGIFDIALGDGSKSQYMGR